MPTLCSLLPRSPRDVHPVQRQGDAGYTTLRGYTTWFKKNKHKTFYKNKFFYEEVLCPQSRYGPFTGPRQYYHLTIYALYDSTPFALRQKKGRGRRRLKKVASRIVDAHRNILQLKGKHGIQNIISEVSYRRIKYSSVCRIVKFHFFEKLYTSKPFCTRLDNNS